nr:reverse transcriptase domain-containing protein [Tanacetum cinerariifolium]
VKNKREKDKIGTKPDQIKKKRKAWRSLKESKVVSVSIKQGNEVTKDPVQTTSPQSTAHVQPLVTQSKTPVSEHIHAPVSALMPNLKPSIPYPSRRENERRREQANEQINKFYEISKDMSFEISFTDALILMPKFDSTLKDFIGNKEMLSEMARTLMNEHCSTNQLSPPLLLPSLPSGIVIFEETDAFLAIEDGLISPKIDDSYYESEGDILLLE